MHALPYQHFRPFNVCSYICTWLNSRLPLPTTTANCPHVGFTALRLPPIANSSTRHVSCHRRRRRRNLQRANSTLCAASISQSASSRNQPQPPSSSFCHLSADEEKSLGLLIPPSDDFCHETQAPSPCFSPVRGIVRAAFVYKHLHTCMSPSDTDTGERSAVAFLLPSSPSSHTRSIRSVLQHVAHRSQG